MPWYAVYTRSRHEDRVHEQLMAKSYHVFLPKIHVWSKRKDRRKKIWVPMFPGYLFVHLLTSPNNYTRLDILKTFGVVKILGKANGGEPIPVPDEHINTINRLISSPVEINHFRYPNVGERARIIDGPFAGIEGIVTASDLEHEVFVVSFELLHRAVAIKLEGFQIAKI
ncbi:MAG: UpxY family transcription antiterminator [Syntrophales bacterium]|nr:UpxY family transcription antiterminator [Syntrophales bacterium]